MNVLKGCSGSPACSATCGVDICTGPSHLTLKLLREFYANLPPQQLHPRIVATTVIHLLSGYFTRPGRLISTSVNSPTVEV
jgi:hypothetical protein